MAQIFAIIIMNQYKKAGNVYEEVIYHIGSKCKISSDTIHGGIYITHAAALKHQFSRTKKKKMY